MKNTLTKMLSQSNRKRRGEREGERETEIERDSDKNDRKVCNMNH